MFLLNKIIVYAARVPAAPPGGGGKVQLLLERREMKECNLSPTGQKLVKIFEDLGLQRQALYRDAHDNITQIVVDHNGGDKDFYDGLKDSIERETGLKTFRVVISGDVAIFSFGNSEESRNI